MSTIRAVKTYTIERRGASLILMSWSHEIAVGPMEVRRFDNVASAKAAAEADAGRALAWREPQAPELKHVMNLPKDDDSLDQIGDNIRATHDLHEYTAHNVFLKPLLTAVIKQLLQRAAVDELQHLYQGLR